MSSSTSGGRPLTSLRDRLPDAFLLGEDDPGVRAVALKARGLSPSYLKLVSAMLDQAREIEGLDQASPATRTAGR